MSNAMRGFLLFAAGVAIGFTLLQVPFLTPDGSRSVGVIDACGTLSSHDEASLGAAGLSECDVIVGLASVLAAEHKQLQKAESHIERLVKEGTQIIETLAARCRQLEQQLEGHKRGDRQAQSPAPATPIPLP